MYNSFNVPEIPRHLDLHVTKKYLSERSIKDVSVTNVRTNKNVILERMEIFRVIKLFPPYLLTIP